MADVWLRKNIVQQECHSESEGGETLEYVYDEVFFRTSDSQETIEADFDGYWESGESWLPAVPLTKEQQRESKIKELEQARNDSDMAIAELTELLVNAVSSVVS